VFVVVTVPLPGARTDDELAPPLVYRFQPIEGT